MAPNHNHCREMRVRITRHAVARWRLRVDPSASALEAEFALQRFLAFGRARPNPRHWTDADPAPGKVFVYNARRPDVCAVIEGGAVKTILTRELCRSTAPHSARALEAVGAVPPSSSRPKVVELPWRWDGQREVA